MVVKIDKLRLSDEYKETLGLVELENEEANISKVQCELVKLLTNYTKAHNECKRDAEEYEQKFFHSKKTLRWKQDNVETAKEFVDYVKQDLDNVYSEKCNIRNEKKKIMSDMLYKWMKDDCDDLDIGDRIQYRGKGITFDVEVVDPSLYQDNPNNVELYELPNR